MTGRTCSIHIDAPVRTVFDVMKDPASFTELMPGVQFTPDVITPDGVGTTYRFQTRVAGLPIRGSGRFTQVETNRHIRDETSIPIEGSFDYWFEVEEGGTRVTIEHHAGSGACRWPAGQLRRDDRQCSRCQAGGGHRTKPGPPAAAAPEGGVMLFMAQPTTLTIHIEAPVAKVFTFWADPGNWKQVAQAEYTFEDIVVTPEGVGTTYREVEKVAPGVRWDYRGRFTDFVVNERIVEEYQGHLAGTFVYQFDPQGSGTQFTLEHIPAAIGKVPSRGRHHGGADGPQMPSDSSRT